MHHQPSPPVVLVTFVVGRGRACGPAERQRPQSQLKLSSNLKTPD